MDTPIKYLKGQSVQNLSWKPVNPLVMSSLCLIVTSYDVRQFFDKLRSLMLSLCLKVGTPKGVAESFDMLRSAVARLRIWYQETGKFTSRQTIHNRLHESDLSTRHFVCVEVLQPSQPNGFMSSVVSLPNHTITGQA